MPSRRYACLLRGVNVSGARKLAMAELRALAERLRFEAPATYLQSGNLVLSSSADPTAIAGRLSAALARETGHRVDVVVRSEAQLDALVRENPFLAEGADPAHLHATFFASPRPVATIDALQREERPPDRLRAHRGGDAVYLHCPRGYARTNLTNAFFERRLRIPATTRNWRTTLRLLELVGGSERKP